VVLRCGQYSLARFNIDCCYCCYYDLLLVIVVRVRTELAQNLENLVVFAVFIRNLQALRKRIPLDWFGCKVLWQLSTRKSNRRCNASATH
jgi:hypothetical protein